VVVKYQSLHFGAVRAQIHFNVLKENAKEIQFPESNVMTIHWKSLRELSLVVPLFT
jgi:hypothetical protein